MDPKEIELTNGESQQEQTAQNSTSGEEHQENEQKDSQKQKENPESLSGILQQLVNASEQSEGKQTSVGQIVEAFGSRAHGPLLLIPALLALIPITGGIPGISITTATIIILVSLNMLFSHGTVWMPKFIRERSVSHHKLEGLVNKNMFWIKWFDKLFQPRLQFMTEKPFSYVIALICIGLSLAMYPLVFIPMGAAPPSFVIMLLALALMAKDGIITIVGMILTGVTAWLTYYLITNFWDYIETGLSWLGLM